MRLPKPGTPVNNLKCKICGKPAKDEKEVKSCADEKCPFKEVK